MHGDGRIDQIAAQRPQPRQDAILVRAGEPAVADHIRAKDRRKFPGLAHRASPSAARLAQRRDQSRPQDQAAIYTAGLSRYFPRTAA